MDNLSFECKLTQRSDSLVVEYTIKNDRQEDLGVFNWITGTAIDGGYQYTPDNVYRELKGDVLVLEKIALPIPPGLRMAAYIPPHASRLRAGESLTETVTVPIPIEVRQPYLRALVGGEVAPRKPVMIREVEVVIGVFPLADCGLVPDHPAFPDVMTAVPPAPAVDGQVKLGARFTLGSAVEVLDYVGFPWP